MDTRPASCRFRLQYEGKPYPRSSCTACGKTVMTGLGNHCTATTDTKVYSSHLTPALRWRWVDKPDGESIKRVRVLEQAWQGSNGRVDWVEVPEAE